VARPNPFERPGESSQQTGGRFEKFWAKFFGREPVKGSGNQWHAPLDVNSIRILFNLKHSREDKLRFGRYRVRDLLQEAETAINGPGGSGGSAVGAAAVSEDGEVYIIFRGHDFLRMAQTGDIHYIVPSKGEQKRARAKIPSLLREDDG
jgi:hypothetical protein